MSKMHIVVEIVSSTTQLKHEGSSAQDALNFLLAHSELQRASISVSVYANAEPIAVLAGIAEMQRRNAAPITEAVAAEGHMTYSERTKGTFRNRK